MAAQKMPVLPLHTEMKRIFKEQGLGDTFDPKSVLPSRAVSGHRTVETSGRDDQQSKLAASESHEHIMELVKRTKGLNDHMKWNEGGTFHHIGGGTVTFYDVFRRCPTNERGVPVDPYTALEMKNEILQSFSGILVRNWCVNDMSDRPWDVIKDSITQFINCGVRVPVVFDANNRAYAHTKLGSEIIRQGAVYAMAYSIARYPNDPTVFNPWEMSDWFIQNIRNIQDEFKSTGEDIDL